MSTCPYGSRDGNQCLNYNPKIGITLGDPAGIGCEVVLKSILHPEKKVERDYIPILIGSLKVVEKTKQILKENFKISEVTSLENLSEGINVFNCVECDFRKITYGKLSREAGRVAYKSILHAIRLCTTKKIDAIVTAPINKASLNLAGFDYPGHTELFAKTTKTKNFAMMLLSEKLKIVLVTTHIPVKEINRKIKRDEIEKKIELTYMALIKYFRIPEPKIGVLALNPHCGEGGLFGTEEEKEIIPAILDAKAKGIRVDGPLSPDTAFLNRDYDCYITMYHDQGLIPFKLLSFGKGVNFTLGLPFIRTSPDHGTAFDIAGKGIADPSSMIEAIRLAVKLSRRKKATTENISGSVWTD